MRPIRLLLVALLTTLLGVGTGAFALRGPDPAPPVASRVDAIAVLRAWDQRRAAAWASGDPEAVSEDSPATTAAWTSRWRSQAATYSTASAPRPAMRKSGDTPAAYPCG